jgi:hypothetical protein
MGTLREILMTVQEERHNEKSHNHWAGYLGYLGYLLHAFPS